LDQIDAQLEHYCEETEIAQQYALYLEGELAGRDLEVK
jgi:hypothetical protein